MCKCQEQTDFKVALRKALSESTDKIQLVVWENKEDSEGLISYARENLSRYKVPRKIFSLKELPRVNGWKLLRRKLREEYNHL